MTDESIVVVTEVAADSGKGQKREKEKSTVPFPYSSLEDGLKLVRAINEVGGHRGELARLAIHLKHENKDSASFRLKLQTAKLFDLIEVSQGVASLTTLGKMVLEPSTQGKGKALAFLRVPLYRKLYDQYNGYALPRDAALESEMRSRGVASKQTERARQVFVRSADEAGYFAYGKQRLVLPQGVSLDDLGILDQKASEQERQPYVPQTQLEPALISAERDASIQPWHPFIQGLLMGLPPMGKQWNDEELQMWLATAEQVLRMLYKVKKAAPGN